MKTSNLKELREQVVAYESKFHINPNTEKRLKALIQQHLIDDKDYLAISKNVMMAQTKAQGFAAMAGFVESCQGGGIVSGARVFTQLHQLQIIQPGMSIEENRENVQQLFDNCLGEESKLKELRETANKLFDLALPYLADLEAKSAIEYRAQLRAHKTFNEKGQLKAKPGKSK